MKELNGFVGREANAQVLLSNEHADAAGCSPSDHAVLDPGVSDFLSEVGFQRADPNSNHKEGEDRQRNNSNLDGDEGPFGEKGADRTWGSRSTWIHMTRKGISR